MSTPTKVYLLGRGIRICLSWDRYWPSCSGLIYTNVTKNSCVHFTRAQSRRNTESTFALQSLQRDQLSTQETIREKDNVLLSTSCSFEGINHKS